jgi:hypothetical protein
MIITKALLQGRGACPGVEDFVAFAGPMGGQLDVSRSTYQHQMMLLASPLKRWWGWAVFTRLISAFSMSGANLRGADLGGADLRGARMLDGTVQR